MILGVSTVYYYMRETEGKERNKWIERGMRRNEPGETLCTVLYLYLSVRVFVGIHGMGF